jgi:Zn-finger nucleic acid-binding protein
LEKAIKCPRCEREMDKAEIAGIQLDVCLTCMGIWFDIRELMQAAALDQEELSRLTFYGDMNAKQSDAMEQPLAFCPR